jgi:hypothetical protein
MEKLMRFQVLSAFVFVLLAAIATAQAPEGFTPLFNGKDLTGWKPTGNAEVWGAENGMIVVAGGKGGWLLTEKDYANFELRLEYKMPKSGNSGVGLRTPLPEKAVEGKKGKGKAAPPWDPAYDGMEIQLIDSANWGKLEIWQLTGSIYHVVPAKKVNNKPYGEWNSMRIVAKDKQILIEQNGEELVNANLADYEKQHAERHPGILRKTGKIGLQSYNFRVEFKNIYVKTLD